MKKCARCGKEYGDTTTLCPSDGTVLSSPVDAMIGQILADKYRVEELINEGGMGAVYRATHILMDKTVAIKVLHTALAADSKIVARFSREARAASRISHPHALNVTDFGESDNGIVFLVMEYLNGRTLKEVVRSEGPLPLARIVEIMRQVSGALDAAHAEGVVHRDLKSDNIMLVDSGGNDWAKVLDFGIAKIQEPMGQDPALTSPNLIIGTPQYMSPEQCSQASEIDARSDIYSMGVILFELLVGHLPFIGESPTAIMMKHIQEPPPSVMDERKDLPAAVGQVVSKSLAKRPEDRFQSAGAMAESLALACEADADTAVLAGAVGGGGFASPDRTTNRIVVTTGENPNPNGTSNTDSDESTIVRPRPGGVPLTGMVSERSEFSGPPTNFNPWRIAIPAVAGLLVVFAVVFALTRGSSPPAANAQPSPLPFDQNSLPVQPVKPATGQAEKSVAAKTPASTPNAQGEVSPQGASNGNRNSSAATDENPSSDANAEPANINRNGNRTKRNSSNAAPTPDTSPSGGNANTPKPSPSPTPRKPALPKPTQLPETPPVVSPPTDGRNN